MTVTSDIEHLVGLNLIRNHVKGRVLAVRVGRDTFVDVVLGNGAFENWYLPACVEAEPGALLRKIEAARQAQQFKKFIDTWCEKPAPTVSSGGKSTAAIICAMYDTTGPGAPAKPAVEPLPPVDRLRYNGLTVEWRRVGGYINCLFPAGYDGTNYLASAYDSLEWYTYFEPEWDSKRAGCGTAANADEAKEVAIRTLLAAGVLTVAPALGWSKSPRGSWGLSCTPEVWTGHSYGAYCDVEKGAMSAEAHLCNGASHSRAKYHVATAKDACILIADWAREDGHTVPPHPIFGSI